MGTGHVVDTDALRKYSKTLAERTQVPAEIRGLVAQSDVGDESWGVVGLFVKSQYTRMLEDLQDLLMDMRDGLRSSSDKFSRAADIYDDYEHSIRDGFNGLNPEEPGAGGGAGGPVGRPGGSGGAGRPAGDGSKPPIGA